MIHGPRVVPWPDNVMALLEPGVLQEVQQSYEDYCFPSTLPVTVPQHYLASMLEKQGQVRESPHAPVPILVTDTKTRRPGRNGYGSSIFRRLSILGPANRRRERSLRSSNGLAARS